MYFDGRIGQHEAQPACYRLQMLMVYLLLSLFHWFSAISGSRLLRILDTTIS